jgi:hypothetical protein
MTLGNLPQEQGANPASQGNRSDGGSACQDGAIPADRRRREGSGELAGRTVLAP